MRRGIRRVCLELDDVETIKSTNRQLISFWATNHEGVFASNPKHSPQST